MHGTFLGDFQVFHDFQSLWEPWYLGFKKLLDLFFSEVQQTVQNLFKAQDGLHCFLFIFLIMTLHFSKTQNVNTLNFQFCNFFLYDSFFLQYWL